MRLVAAVLAVVLTGCSVLFVAGPPDPLPPPPRSNIKCDRSADGLIAADIVIGSLLGLIMYGLGRANFCHDNCPPDPPAYKAPLVGIGVALPFYLSAWAGSSRASSCRKAQDAQ
jgi:hypothetical protein